MEFCKIIKEIPIKDLQCWPRVPLGVPRNFSWHIITDKRKLMYNFVYNKLCLHIHCMQ